MLRKALKALSKKCLSSLPLAGDLEPRLRPFRRWRHFYVVSPRVRGVMTVLHGIRRVRSDEGENRAGEWVPLVLKFLEYPLLTPFPCNVGRTRGRFIPCDVTMERLGHKFAYCETQVIITSEDLLLLTLQS